MLVVCIEDVDERIRKDDSYTDSCKPHQDSSSTLNDRRLAKKRLKSMLEDLIWDLFCQHDLNGNGWFEESELILINKQIQIIHHGKEDINIDEIEHKYQTLFRTKLDPDGRPVPYDVFRLYMFEYLNELDPDPEAQLMILEQFIAEAYCAHQAILFPGPEATTEAATPVDKLRRDHVPPANAAPLSRQHSPDVVDIDGCDPICKEATPTSPRLDELI
jgi:hypothetical protein